MISISVKKATTNMEKIVGLIGKKAPYPLLLETKFGIHTFGVRFPIDVIILDKTGTVQDIKEALKPNRIFFWNPSFSYVVELPMGTIKTKKITKGEKIKLMIQ